MQLEDGCVDVATPGALPALAPLNLSWSTEGALAYVGAFGDAHPAVGDHWVPLKLASGGASVAPSWDAQNGICKNMLKAVVRLRAPVPTPHPPPDTPALAPGQRRRH